MQSPKLTLDDFVNILQIGIPTISAKRVEGISGSEMEADGTPRKESRVLSSAQEFSRNCLGDLGLRADILPLATPAMEHLALIFANNENGFHVGTGAYNLQENTMVLSIHEQQDRWYFQILSRENSGTCITCLCALRVPMKQEETKLLCVMFVATTFQMIVEEVLRDLANFVCYQNVSASAVVFEAALQKGLENLGLAQSMGKIVDLARSSDPRALTQLCYTLHLESEEWQLVASVWEQARNGVIQIHLPNVAKKMFCIKPYIQPRWIEKPTTVNVSGRYPEVQPTIDGLLCPPNLGVIMRLVEQIEPVCAPFEVDYKYWLPHAGRAALITLLHQKDPFEFKLY